MTYKRYIPVFIVAGCFLALYHHVILTLINDWRIDDNFSHGFLVPFISGYLIWQNRQTLSKLSIMPGNIGLLLICFSIAFYIFAYTGAELFTQRFSMILVMLSTVVFLAGWSYLKVLFFPIIYLILMIPIPAIIWNKIAFPLKLFATHWAVNTIQLLGITVYSEGNIIYLANTTLQVVDACSGLRSLTSLIALSAAFALITTHSRLKKIILFLSAIPIAIATNIFRLILTAVLAKEFGPQVAQGFLHEASGIMVFLIALILLFLLNILLARGSKKEKGV